MEVFYMTKKTSKQRLSIAEYAAQAMLEYGSEVVEQRAIPDYRDGLKPVQRMILWAAYKLGCHHTSGFKKAARIVGDTIGKYHPHGDISTYEAMVNIAGVMEENNKAWLTRNCTVPLIEGYGNWGDFIDAAAASRYTEARLSKFSDLFLLDADYLEVVDKIPNYDASELIPVILPAKLPVLLLNGNYSIAVGIAASSPALHIQGILFLVKKLLNKEKIDLDLCVKKLKFSYPYGGDCISSRKTIKEAFKGKGSVVFMPSFVVNLKNKEILFDSVCPGLSTENAINTWLENMYELKDVSSVDSSSSREGPTYLVTGKKSLTLKEFKQLLTKVSVFSEKVTRFDIGISIRQKDGTAKFKKSSVLEILEMWVIWRIELEILLIHSLMAKQKAKLARQNLILLAVDNLQIVIDALKCKHKMLNLKGENLDGSVVHLIKKLRVTKEQANYILDMKVRQLKQLERQNIISNIKAIQKEIEKLKCCLKHPQARILEDLEKLELQIKM